MVSEKPSIFEFLRRYYEGTDPLNMLPVAIFDSSAVLDLEHTYQKVVGVVKAYFSFIDLAKTGGRSMTFLVPQMIKEELERHVGSIRGGKPELSHPSWAVMRNLPATTPELSLFAELQEQRFDYARYVTRGIHYGQIQGKKAEQDPISREDWSVIDLALLTSIYSEATVDQNMKGASLSQPFRGCYKTAVLSADKHILWTLRRLFQEPEGIGLNRFLHPVDMREYTLYDGGGKTL